MDSLVRRVIFNTFVQVVQDVQDAELVTLSEEYGRARGGVGGAGGRTRQGLNECRVATGT